VWSWWWGFSAAAKRSVSFSSTFLVFSLLVCSCIVKYLLYLNVKSEKFEFYVVVLTVWLFHVYS